MERITLITKASADYELLDSGIESARPNVGHSGGEKLERFGSVILARPDPQALWAKTAEGGSPGSLELREKWQKADGRYVRQGREGKWFADNLPKEWEIGFGGLTFIIRPTSFKHTGLFPEQLSNWEWVKDILRKNLSAPHKSSLLQRVEPDSSAKTFVRGKPAVLNLFGYTGGATLAAAQAGAEVTHVDASKTAVAWARENAAASGLQDAPIHWVVEDVLQFVRREIKRGKRYDGIIMDPPAFGRGPKKEVWKIEENLLELVELCRQLLSDEPLFFLINGYAAGYSPLAFAYNLEQFKNKFNGSIEYGDLAIEDKNGRLLPCGIFARWYR